MKISTTQQLISIGSRFAYGTVDMTPIKADILFARGKNPLSTWTLRELAGTQAISLVDVSDQNAKQITIADGSALRIGEILQVTDDSGDDQGAVRVDSIDGDIITYSIIGDYFTPVATGSIEYREDEKLLASQTKTLNTKRYPFFLAKAMIDTGSDNLSIADSSEETPTQKKN